MSILFYQCSHFLELYVNFWRCFVTRSNENPFFPQRGRELQKRVAERLKEAEMDSRDRLKEKEEIEELKNRIFSGDHEDPSAEFEKVIIFFFFQILIILNFAFIDIY